MLRTVTLLLAILASSALFAQDETLLSKFRLDFSGAWGGWHSQLTDIGGNNTVVHGGFGGLEFNKVLFIGWSAYKNSDNVIAPNDELLRYDLSYNGPIIAYTPRARSVIHPKFQLQIGNGKLDIEGRNRDRFLVLQPAIGGEVNVLRWFRVGGQAGYRFNINSDYPADSVGDTDGFFLEGTIKFGFSWGNGLKDTVKDLDD